MNLFSPTSLAFLLSLGTCALAGCATDHVEVDALEVSLPGTTSSSATAAVAISSALDAGELEVRLNGSYLVAGSEPLYLANTGTLGFSVSPGRYVLELIDANGDVVLRSSPQEFASDRLSEVVIFDAGPGLDYIAYSNGWNEPEEGAVRATFNNVTSRKLAGRLDMCPISASSENCELLVEEIAYGESWSGDVPEGLRFVFTPNGDHGPVEFWSAEFGSEGARVQSYGPLEWVDFSDSDCPGCTAVLEVGDFMFRQ